MLSNGPRTISVPGAGPPSPPTSRTEPPTPRTGASRTCPLPAKPATLRRPSRTFASSSTSTSAVMPLEPCSAKIRFANGRTVEIVRPMSAATLVISRMSTGRSSTSTSTSYRRPFLLPLRLPSPQAPPPPSSARLRPAPLPSPALP